MRKRKISNLHPGEMAEIVDLYDGSYQSLKELAGLFNVPERSLRFRLDYDGEKEKVHKASRRWRLKHQRRHNVSCRRYYRKHRKRIQAEQRRRYRNDPVYREKTKQRFYIYVRKKYHSDPVFRKKLLKVQARWYRRNRSKIRARHRRRYRLDKAYRERRLQYARTYRRKLLLTK